MAQLATNTELMWYKRYARVETGGNNEHCCVQFLFQCHYDDPDLFPYSGEISPERDQMQSVQPTENKEKSPFLGKKKKKMLETCLTGRAKDTK